MGLQLPTDRVLQARVAVHTSDVREQKLRPEVLRDPLLLPGHRLDAEQVPERDGDPECAPPHIRQLAQHQRDALAA